MQREDRDGPSEIFLVDRISLQIPLAPDHRCWRCVSRLLITHRAPRLEKWRRTSVSTHSRPTSVRTPSHRRDLSRFMTGQMTRGFVLRKYRLHFSRKASSGGMTGGGSLFVNRLQIRRSTLWLSVSSIRF